MNILIDFGNSRCKWARLSDGIVQSGAAISYQGSNLQSLIKDLINKLPVDQCQCIHVVSVLSNEFNQEFITKAQALHDVEIRFYQAQRDAFGIELAYQDPASYGADRYAALVAAHHFNSQAKIIVDCGTAVTVDAIDNKGTHLGGLIVPGVDVMSAMLANNTQIEPRSDSQQVIEYFNDTTERAVISGSTLCLQHGLSRIIKEMKNKLQQQTTIFVTGGAVSSIILGYEKFEARPELVLEGIAIMQRN